MTQLRILVGVLIAVAIGAGVALSETTISMAISGPGAVNDSTIKAGEPVSVDIYWENGDDDRRGFTTGFKITSDTIRNIIHVVDSGNGVNAAGDIKAHGGWEGTKAWDFTGIKAVIVDWDGELPETIGFGGLRVKNVYNAHEKKKVLSWTMIVPEVGTISIDSSFYKPGGIWAIVGADGVEIPPVWEGPYIYQVVE